MKVVYIDVLFILNALSDLALLICTGRLCDRYAKLWRVLLSSFAGGAYAVLSEVFPLLAHPLSVIICSALLCFIAYGKSLRLWGVFLLCSACLGGAVWALCLRGLGKITASCVCLIGLSVSVLLMLLLGGKAKAQKGGMSAMTVTLLGRSTVFSALIDTGNSLRDPITGNDIVIISPEKFSELMPSSLKASLHSLSPPDAVSLLAKTRYASRFRLLSYKTVSGDGIMLAFRPDALIIDGKKTSGTLIAVSPAELCAGVCSALV